MKPHDSVIRDLCSFLNQFDQVDYIADHGAGRRLRGTHAVPRSLAVHLPNRYTIKKNFAGPRDTTGVHRLKKPIIFGSFITRDDALLLEKKFSPPRKLTKSYLLLLFPYILDRRTSLRILFALVWFLRHRWDILVCAQILVSALFFYLGFSASFFQS